MEEQLLEFPSSELDSLQVTPKAILIILETKMASVLQLRHLLSQLELLKMRMEIPTGILSFLREAIDSEL